MNETTLASAGHVSRSESGRIDAWCRTAVLRGLESLGHDALTLEDGRGRRAFGPGGGLTGRVRVANDRFYRRVLLGGSLGAAESYMDGDWTADDLPAVLRIFARDLDGCDRMESRLARLRSISEKVLRQLQPNTPSASARHIHAHYDLGNAFFALFLDETLNYSSGIFEHPGASMKDASIAKMERVCRKLDLNAGTHLLEIGTGWGALAIHAASRYGCRVTTATISRQQHARALERVRAAGLESRVEVLLEDYRNLSGRYHRIASIEMIEAVGHAYMDTYFRQCGRLLQPDGLILIQAIVTPEHRFEASRKSVDFIRRHVFPGSCLTSLGQMSASIGRVTDFRTVHVEDIGPHYAETLRRWRQRFQANRGPIRELGYDDRFLRMWDYYLAYSEAGFEERIIGDVQMLLERPRSRRRPLLGTLS